MAASGGFTPHNAEALAAFQHQLAELDAVRAAHAWHPMFRAWRERTDAIFERFLPDSASRAGFLAIQFSEVSSSGGPDADTNSHAMFAKACDSAAACLKSAISQLEEAGADSSRAPSPAK